MNSAKSLLRIVLAIEPELLKLEKIFTRHISLPSDITFIKGSRYPVGYNTMVGNDIRMYMIDDKAKNINLARMAERDLVSNVPFYPIVSVECLVNMLIKHYINNAKDKTLFHNNPLCENSAVIMSKRRLLEYDDETCFRYLSHGVTVDEIETIIKIILTVFEDFYKLVPENFRNNRISFSVDSENIICDLGEDIRAFRFEEAFEYKEHN
jgi:hypothetical protein